MKKNHPKKVFRRKPPASRGKQVAKRHTAEFGFRNAISFALLSSFGISLKAQSKDASITGFIDKRAAAIRKKPRSALEEYKKNITSIRLNTLQGRSSDRSLLGRVLPRRFSKKPKVGQLLQFVRIGRALPKVPVEPKDLSDQLDRMVQPFDTPVPDEVKEVLEKISWPNVAKAPFQCSDFVSSASCKEANRRAGGRTSLVKESKMDLGTIESASSGLVRVDRSAVEFARVMLVNKKYKSSSDCVPLAIAELGAKVRIVTKHDAMLVAFSHRARRALWPLLTESENITVSESISDPELGKIVFPEYRKDTDKYMVFSADLSAATDYLGWPVICLICDLAKFPLVQVCPTTVNEVEVHRGTAMGLPASWAVLSLAHYAVCKAVDKSHSFRIKGDDLVALWSEEEIAEYYRLCGLIGFVPNRSKSALDRRRGIFCEVSYYRYENTLIRQPDFSIRSFVKNEPLSAEQWQMLVKHGADQSTLYKLAKAAHTSWLKMTRKSKINPYMPRRMGGLGFPPKKMDLPLSRRDSRIVNIVHNGLLPSLIEEKPQGQASKIYMEYIRKHIRWTCQGGSHFNTYVFKEHSPRFLFRGAFVDAIRGESRPVVTRHRDVVRRVGELLKRIMSQPGKPYRTTYGEAYRLIDRLQVTRDSDVLGLGATHWNQNSEKPGFPMAMLKEIFDEDAAAICGRGLHLGSTCSIDAQDIFKNLKFRSVT